MKNIKSLLSFSSLLLLLSVNANGQNPIIKDQFTADPTARVFEGKVYLYPSHDIPAPSDYSRKDWFCMEDYHVYSSENLTDWKDHGIIVSQESVPWVAPKSYSMWAPDCVYKNGKYYFYFPSAPKGEGMRGFGVGVATSDKPYGPFTPEEAPIKGVFGIDPCVLVDADGQSYIYWSAGGISVAKLKDNMMELDSKPLRINTLPKKGLIEGPFAFQRNGKYYLTFPWVRENIEVLAYAMSDNPMGPFEFTGIIMDESPTGCWTNHHSIVEYNGQWYLFYHHNDYSPKFDKNRSTRIDSLSFNADGTIQKVIRTERGVGVHQYAKTIEIDRFSKKSDNAAIEYINREIPTLGWKVVFSKPEAWVSYNSVQFPEKSSGKLNLTSKVKSEKGATLQVWSQVKSDKKLLGEIKVPASTEWQNISSTVKGSKGLQNVVLSMKEGESAEVDNITFAE